MKRMIVILMILALLTGTWALSEAAEGLSWRGYRLQATWLTTDAEDINIRDLRTDGQFVMIRFEPTEGTIAYSTVNENAGGEFWIALANGETMPIATVIYHNIKLVAGSFGMNEEQDDFDGVFFLEGGSLEDLEGASLVVSDEGTQQSLPLQDIPTEKPE